MKLKSVASVKSADRAFDILEHVAEAAEPPSFSSMMVDLVIPRSSLFHLLNNLLARKYLAQDPDTGRYRLGEQIRELAKNISGPSIAAVVSPFLKKMTDELNETSGFYIPVGDAVEASASVTGSQALAYTMKVGENAPLYAVSGGKIVLARMSADRLEDYFRATKFEAITPKTKSSKRELREEIALVKKSGFAYSYEEFTIGIIGIATAVESDGRFVGSLNLAVPTVRFTKDREVIFRRVLKTVATSIGQALASCR